MHAMIRKNLKNWKDCLSFIEFAYNQSVHCITNFSQFVIIYGFNLQTLFDLLHFSVNEMTNLDGQKKAEMIKESWIDEETPWKCTTTHWKQK